MENRLFEISRKLTFSTKTDEELRNEKFKNVGRVHDWRNYIPIELQELWSELTDRERRLVFMFCEKESNDEEWD